MAFVAMPRLSFALPLSYGLATSGVV